MPDSGKPFQALTLPYQDMEKALKGLVLEVIRFQTNLTLGMLWLGSLNMALVQKKLEFGQKFMQSIQILVSREKDLL